MSATVKDELVAALHARAVEASQERETATTDPAAEFDRLTALAAQLEAL